MNPQPNPKVIIIGLDGVPFEYLDPLLEKGELPNIQKVIRRGFRARLHSTYPPMTPVAWPSLSTGMQPGNHGIFGWWKLTSIDEEAKVTSVSAKDIKAEPIWNILSKKGIRVGVVNVPLTYPAVDVNGFLIPGFDNPFDEFVLPANFTYPQDLLAQLRENGCDYKVLELIESDLPLTPSQLDESLQHWIAAELNRTKSCIWLIRKYQPEFMMVVYHMADYFMHRAGRTSELVKSALQTLDQCVGQLIAACDQETTILITSDHGSIELQKYVYLQKWLMDNELLYFKNNIPADNLDIIVKAEILNSAPSLDYDTVRVLSKSFIESWNSLPESLQVELTKQLMIKYPACCVSDLNVDWSKTKAFTISSYGEIYINLVGRQSDGIVSPGKEYDDLVRFIRQSLIGLKDPETGEVVISEIVHKDDFYSGKEIEKAPDLFCLLSDPKYYFMRYSFYMRPATTYRDLAESKLLIRSVTKQDDFVGDHTPFGILIGAGPTVKSTGQLPTAEITDVMPTVLALLGVPIPENLDGKALAEVFDIPNITYTKASETTTDDMHETRPEDKETAESIRRKLRSLGYRV